MQNLSQLFDELEQEGFYGSVEVKLEAGTVVLVKKTETIKPVNENYRDNRGESNARSTRTR